mmetsp:Transcript_22346/g.40168  ORF Transcript_22346/g.40168 Transcript_22346/m.40168 type:complete len:296 (-) Transcript_22346:1061-1948(-)
MHLWPKGPMCWSSSGRSTSAQRCSRSETCCGPRTSPATSTATGSERWTCASWPARPQSTATPSCGTRRTPPRRWRFTSSTPCSRSRRSLSASARCPPRTRRWCGSSWRSGTATAGSSQRGASRRSGCRQGSRGPTPPSQTLGPWPGTSPSPCHSCRGLPHHLCSWPTAARCLTFSLHLPRRGSKAPQRTRRMSMAPRATYWWGTTWIWARIRFSAWPSPPVACWRPPSASDPWWLAGLLRAWRAGVHAHPDWRASGPGWRALCTGQESSFFSFPGLFKCRPPSSFVQTHGSTLSH